MAQLVEALRYKPEGRGFDSRWCHWNFSSTKSFRPHYGPGVDSASNRNEYQEYFLGGKGGQCVGFNLTTCADCLQIWELQPPGILRTCPSLSWDCFTFTFTFIVMTRQPVVGQGLLIIEVSKITLRHTTLGRTPLDE